MTDVSKAQLNVLRSGLADALEVTVASLTALMRMSRLSPEQVARRAELADKKTAYAKMLAQLDNAAQVYDELATA